MRSIIRNKSPRVDEENPYWISFSDLMSALLVIFILASVALIIELTQTQKKVEQDIKALQNAQQARKDILTEVVQELRENHGINVIFNKDKTGLIIPDPELAFESGRYVIPTEKLSSVTIVGHVLHVAINRSFSTKTGQIKRSEYLDTIFIEGHTDSVPAKRLPGGNWALSTRRAISVWDLWKSDVSLVPSYSELRNYRGASLFSVSGYAATRRVIVDEVDDEDKKKNRRIEIRFTVKPPEVADLEKAIAL